MTSLNTTGFSTTIYTVKVVRVCIYEMRMNKYDVTHKHTHIYIYSHTHVYTKISQIKLGKYIYPKSGIHGILSGKISDIKRGKRMSSIRIH